MSAAVIRDDAPMREEAAGFELALMLIAAFRALIDELHDELATLGYRDARPLHGFALQAVGSAGATISELGRRLGVSKQAAAKTARHLEQLGYLARAPHPRDERAALLTRTSRGEQFLADSARGFTRLRDRWIHELGADRIAVMEADLQRMAAPAIGKLGDLPGWLR
jgi:DNA-binding MarR family transcriptional regulator